MMEGGLLHSPPKDVLNGYPELFDDIENCVYTEENIDRFFLTERILERLSRIIQI